MLRVPRRVSAVAALVAALCSLSLLAGCGNSRAPVPNPLLPAAPASLVRDRFPRAGISFKVPSNWAKTIGDPPLVAAINSGPAVIALASYKRIGAPPADPLALAQTRDQLVAAARAVDPSLAVIRSKLTTIARAPAIVLDATETNSGRLRRVRSIHIFVTGGEIVIDEYAPPSMFHEVDHDVFSPLNHSLALLHKEGRA